MATVRPSSPQTGMALQRRQEARARFEADGFPRPGDEDWRQTNVAPIAATTFADAERGGRPHPSPLDEPLGGPRIVFVDGHLVELEEQEGARVLPLSRAVTDASDLLHAHLARHAKIVQRPFAALNTAALQEGAVIVLPAGRIMAAPVQIVHRSTGAGTPTATHPRTLVIAGEGSQATVVETFLGRPPGRTLTNAVAELVLEPRAIHHVRVVDEGEAWHVGTVQAYQGRDSRLVSHNLCLGAALTRVDLGSVLDGQGAESLLHGLYVAEGHQHVDNHTFLEHAKPHCPSREMYKGILSGNAARVQRTHPAPERRRPTPSSRTATCCCPARPPSSRVPSSRSTPTT
jgi:Fe-S cluster assembly protein SufD